MEQDQALERRSRIRTRRVYSRSPGEIGPAFLLDRLWPRGLRRADRNAHLDPPR